jgi:DNA-directed RNA polymerase subunit RPC12/RpoP
VKKKTLPELLCPRCGHSDTVPLRNYGRPMVGDQPGTSQWHCLECSHRFDGPKVLR